MLTWPVDSPFKMTRRGTFQFRNLVCIYKRVYIRDLTVYEVKEIEVSSISFYWMLFIFYGIDFFGENASVSHTPSQIACCLTSRAQRARASQITNPPISWRASAATWWRHQIETFSALLALCAGNSPVPVNSPHKGQWRGALMFSLICALINNWVNNPKAGDLRRRRGHCDVNVMKSCWPIVEMSPGGEVRHFAHNENTFRSMSYHNLVKIKPCILT